MSQGERPYRTFLITYMYLGSNLANLHAVRGAKERKSRGMVGSMHDVPLLLNFVEPREKTDKESRIRFLFGAIGKRKSRKEPGGTRQYNGRRDRENTTARRIY